jgi:hypothetical protein
MQCRQQFLLFHHTSSPVTKPLKKNLHHHSFSLTKANHNKRNAVYENDEVAYYLLNIPQNHFYLDDSKHRSQLFLSQQCTPIIHTTARFVENKSTDRTTKDNCIDVFAKKEYSI